ncbi:unnamed protein product [Anisakis simplex]|uniref:Probable prefoldin subunit 6 n=1 Tax=Anisakis simplex TaxID=6269 RepID=A0A158PP66_ANISI|nr:unnamed protein product [Anisakis simplex]
MSLKTSPLETIALQAQCRCSSKLELRSTNFDFRIGGDTKILRGLSLYFCLRRQIMTASMDPLKSRFEEELTKFKRLEKDRERNMLNRQQLEGQLTENSLVKTELDLLDDDATVYKLIGPVLVKQDLSEARQNVDKRIDYINTEIKRLEETMADAEKKQEEQRIALMKIQTDLRGILSKEQR